jgi:hypothetical protein
MLSKKTLLKLRKIEKTELKHLKNPYQTDPKYERLRVWTDDGGMIGLDRRQRFFHKIFQTSINLSK